MPNGHYFFDEVIFLRIKATLMEEMAVKRALMRISHEIIEKNKGIDNVCVVGIRRHGAAIAETIAKNIELIEGKKIPCGDMDISHYRDDVKHREDGPVLNKVSLPFNVENKKIILVDDVLYTGRTARAAIEAIFSLGRPDSIQLAILIDRGHRELPIRADYVGKSIPTSRDELIEVLFPPYDEETAVKLLDR